jgi:hypothetical protein
MNIKDYPPGKYTFAITGTVGTKSDSILFEMTLVDPCPYGLELKFPPFNNMQYVLKDPALSQTIAMSEIVEVYTGDMCG